MLTSTHTQKALPLKMNCDIQQWIYLIDLAEILFFSYSNILIIYIYIVRLASGSSNEPAGTEEMSHGLNTRKGCETLTSALKILAIMFHLKIKQATDKPD